MPVPASKASELYKKLIEDGYTAENIGSEEEFTKKASTKEGASKLHTVLLSEGYTVDNLGDVNEFTTKLVSASPDKKKVSTTEQPATSKEPQVGDVESTTSTTEPSPDKSYYRVDYRDEKNQPAHKYFESEEASRIFFKNVPTPPTGVEGYYEKLPKGEVVEKVEIPVSTNPIDLSFKVNELSQKTIPTGVASPTGVIGVTPIDLTTYKKDEKAVSEAQKIKSDLTAQGYDADKLFDDFNDIDMSLLEQEGTAFSKDVLMQEYKENPNKYEKDLAGLKLISLQRKAVAELPENEAENISQISISDGNYDDIRNNNKDISKRIRGYAGDYSKDMIKSLATIRANDYGGAIANDELSIQNDNRNKYLNKYQIGALQYLEDINPEAAKGYESLIIDPSLIKKNTYEEAGWQEKASSLELTGMQLYKNYLESMLNAPDLMTFGEEYAATLLSGLDKVNKDINNISTKYPIPASKEAHQAAMDLTDNVIGSGWANRPFLSVGNALDNTISGIWDFISEPFRNEESSKLYQLATLGEGMTSEFLNYLPKSKQQRQTYDWQLSPELDKGYKAIMKDESLSENEKTAKVYKLLQKNPNGYTRVPVISNKLNINPASMYYSVVDLAASLVPYMALEMATGGGATAGIVRKLASSFTAAAATGFHDNYLNAIREGSANPYKQALITTAIMSAAMAGAGTPQMIKSMLGAKTAIGEMVSKLTDDEIAKVLNKIKDGSLKSKIIDYGKSIGLNAPKSIAEGAAGGMKFELVMAVGKKIDQKIKDEEINDEELFIEAVMGVLNFTVFGGVSGIAKTAWKGLTAIQKGALLKASQNPSAFLSAAQKQLADNLITRDEYAQIKNNIELAANVADGIKYVDDNGNQLSEIKKAELLVAKMQEAKLKEQSIGDIPEKLREKIDNEVEEVQQEIEKIQTSEEYDTEDTKGLPSEVRVGEELIQAEPVESTGAQKIGGGGVLQENVPSGEGKVAEVTQGEVTPIENPKVVITGTRQGMESLESANYDPKVDKIKDARGREFDDNGILVEKDDKGNQIINIKVDAVDSFGRDGYLQTSVIVPEGANINSESIKKIVDTEIDKIKAKDNKFLELNKVQESDFTALKNAVVNELKKPSEPIQPTREKVSGAIQPTPEITKEQEVKGRVQPGAEPISTRGAEAETPVLTSKEKVTKKASDILLDYKKGDIIDSNKFAAEEKIDDDVVNTVFNLFKNKFKTIKISGKRPTEGAAFYNKTDKQIDLNKNSDHWNQVESSNLINSISHEYTHHLLEESPNNKSIEKDLSNIKNDLIKNKPQNMTEAESRVFGYMTAKNNSPQEIITYAVSNPEIRKYLAPYAEKINEISNQIIGKDIITEKDIKSSTEIPVQKSEKEIGIEKKEPIFVEQKTKDEQTVRPESRGERTGREGVRTIAPLEGAPSVPGINGGDPQLVAVAEEYAKQNGIPLKRQAEYAKVDENRARRIADEYEKMKHDPQNPRVKEAYQNLIKQTIAQYKALVDAGYKFWFIDANIPSNAEYASTPYNALRDARQNKTMGVFPTTDGFGTNESIDVSDNPLMAETGFYWSVGGLDGQKKPVLANDLFRAVHDMFGHGLEGAGFRARGEENAWQAHVRLYTGSAIGALTSETRGQNSWLNYGKYGEQNQKAKTEDTIFADQKTGLMPEWTWTEGRVGDMEEAKVETKETTAEQTSKQLADKIRGLKIGNKNLYVLPDLGLTKTIYDGALDFLANQIEKGTSLGKAIEATIKYIDSKLNGQKWNKELFNRHSISIVTESLVKPGEQQPAMIIKGKKNNVEIVKFSGETSSESLRQNSPDTYINRAYEISDTHLVPGKTKKYNKNWSLESKLKWADEIYKKAKETVKSNLLFIYNNIPENVRTISKLWYDGANKIAQEFAKKYNLTVEQTAAIIATLSPQKPWFDNLHIAQFIIDFNSKNQDKLLSKDAYEYFKKTGEDYPAQVAYLPTLEKSIGKKYSELSDYDKSIMIRYEFDNFYERRAPLRLPTGHIIGLYEKKSSFSGYDKMSDAISIINDGSAENISNNIGADSKVRNFYNNIVDPASANHATIDTHAIAAGYLLPIGASDSKIKFDFGTYSFFFDAYKEAAKEVGVLPREMQSIVWEGIKSLYPPEMRNNANKEYATGIWEKYKNGELTLEEVQNKIKENGKELSTTDWSTGIDKSLEESKNRGYIGELPTISGDKIAAGERGGRGVESEVSSMDIEGGEVAEGKRSKNIVTSVEEKAKVLEKYPELKDTKAVDKKGNPLLLYHGGIKFDDFKPSQLKEDKGIYFTDNKDLALYFAHQAELIERDKRGDDYGDIPNELLESGEPFPEKYLKYAKVHSAYLDMKNPTIVDAIDAGAIPKNYEPNTDGFIAKSTGDFGYKGGQYVVFEPSQIKKAEFVQQKSVAEESKKIADNLRKAKIKLGDGGLQSNIAGLPIAIYNAVIETIATSIEKGATLAEAISNAIKEYKLNENKEFDENALLNRIKSVTEAPVQENPFENIPKTQVARDKYFDTTFGENADKAREIYNQGGTPAEMLAKMQEAGLEPPVPPTKEKATLSAEPEKVGIRKEDIKELAAKYDLDIAERREAISDAEIQTMAKNLIANGYDVNKLVQECLAPEKRPLTDIEANILAEVAADMKAKIDSKSSNADIAKYRDVLSALNRGISENARGLRMAQVKKNVVESIADVMADMMDDTMTDELTPEQRKQAEERFNDIKVALDKETELRKQAEKEIDRLKAELEIKKQKTRTENKPRKSKQDYATERKAIIQSIKDKWNKASKGEGGLTMAVVPYQSQLMAIAPDVAKLVKSYLEQGAATTLEEVRALLKKDIQDAGVDVQDEDVRGLIAGNYTKKKPTRNQYAKQLYELRQEEKLLLQIEALERGEEPTTEKKRIEKNQKLKELRDKIKELTGKEVPKREKKEKTEKTEKTEDEKFEQAVNARIKTNQKKQSEIQDKINRGDFSPEVKKLSILENTELQKNNKALYDSYLKSVLDKDEALLDYEKARVADQMKNRTKLEKLSDGLDVIIQTSKGTVVMADQSFTLVQMLPFAFSHPIEMVKFAARAAKNFASKTSFDKSMAILHSTALWDIIEKSGLAIYEPRSAKSEMRNELHGGDKNLWNKEINVGGKKISVGQAFERSATTALNNARLYLFMNSVQDLYNAGKTFENSPESFKAAARIANEFTGHGKVHEMFQNKNWGKIIWSTKMFSSTFNLLGLGDLIRPVATANAIGRRLGITTKETSKYSKGFYTSLTADQAKFATKELTRFVVGGMMIMIATKLSSIMAGDDDDEVVINMNPKSTDFGNMIVGGKKISIYGRFGSAVRTVCQVILGERTTAEGENKALGDGYGNKTSGEVMFGSFVRGKMTPSAGIAYDFILNNKKNYYTKEELSAKEIAKQLTIPLAAREVFTDIDRDGALVGTIETIAKIYGATIRDERDFIKAEKPTFTELEMKDENDKKVFDFLKKYEVPVPVFQDKKKYRIEVDAKHPEAGKTKDGKPYALYSDEEFKMYNDFKKDYIIKALKILNRLDKSGTVKLSKEVIEDKLKSIESQASRVAKNKLIAKGKIARKNKEETDTDITISEEFAELFSEENPEE